MSRTQLHGAQADADATVDAVAPASGTAIRLFGRDRDGPGLLSLIAAADFGFLIAVRDRVYVHVQTGDDGVWEYVPLDASP